MDNDAGKINGLDDDPTSELEALPEKLRVNVDADSTPDSGVQTPSMTQQIEDLSKKNKQLASELEIKNEFIDLYRREIRVMKQMMLTAGNQNMNRMVPDVEETGRNELLREVMLVALNGEASMRYAVGPGRTTLGSSPDNDIQLNSNFISRHHAEIVCNSGDYILGDLNSTNGTFVNSNRIKRHALREGDSITIGTLRLKFVMDSSSAQGSESPTTGAQR